MIKNEKEIMLDIREINNTVNQIYADYIGFTQEEYEFVISLLMDIKQKVKGIIQEYEDTIKTIREFYEEE